MIRHQQSTHTSLGLLSVRKSMSQNLRHMRPTPTVVRHSPQHKPIYRDHYPEIATNAQQATTGLIERENPEASQKLKARKPGLCASAAQPSSPRLPPSTHSTRHRSLSEAWAPLSEVQRGDACFSLVGSPFGLTLAHSSCRRWLAEPDLAPRAWSSLPPSASTIPIHYPP